MKKDNLGVNLARLFSSVKSESEGRDAAEGIRFVKRCMKPIVTVGLSTQALEWAAKWIDPVLNDL